MATLQETNVKIVNDNVVLPQSGTWISWGPSSVASSGSLRVGSTDWSIWAINSGSDIEVLNVGSGVLNLGDGVGLVDVSINPNTSISLLIGGLSELSVTSGEVNVDNVLTFGGSSAASGQIRGNDPFSIVVNDTTDKALLGYAGVTLTLGQDSSLFMAYRASGAHTFYVNGSEVMSLSGSSAYVKDNGGVRHDLITDLSETTVADAATYDFDIAVSLGEGAVTFRFVAYDSVNGRIYKYQATVEYFVHGGTLYIVDDGSASAFEAQHAGGVSETPTFSVAVSSTGSTNIRASITNSSGASAEVNAREVVFQENLPS